MPLIENDRFIKGADKMKLLKNIFLILTVAILITAMTSCEALSKLFPTLDSGDCELYSEHKFENKKADAFSAAAADCTSPAEYYMSCDCGARSDTTFTDGEALGHSFIKYYSNRNATCLDDATETAKCERCDAFDTRDAEGSALGHSFVNYVSDGDATCTADGHKTAKCERCEEPDRITDEGSALGHSFVNYIPEGDATCAADGHKMAKCERCKETNRITDEGSMLPHSFASNYSANETHHWYASTCGHNVTDSEEMHTFVDKICTKCTYRQPEAFIVSIKDAQIHGSQIDIITKGESFSDVLTDVVCSEGAGYALFKNAECTEALSPSDSLQNGYNTAYIKVTSGGGTQSLVYTLTVYKTFRVTVTYTADGSTVNTEEADSGFEFTVSYTPDGKYGYSFKGWLLADEGYTGGMLYGDITLTANYEPNTYKIEFNANGGECSADSVDAIFDAHTELPTPTREGFRFEGWQDADGNAYSTGIWQTAADITLIAQWSLIPEADIISIKDADIHGNEIDITVRGASLGDALIDVICSDGAAYSVYRDAECTEFLGADTPIQNGLNVIYIKVTASDGIKTRTYTVSIYKSFSVTVTYKVGGTTVNTVTADSGYVFTPEYTPANKVGHSFGGWMLGDAKYTPTVILGDITLTGSYTANTYRITLDPNGGNVAKEEIIVTYGAKYSLFIPAKGLDYSFEGWVDQNGRTVANNGTWTGTEDIILTAKWRKRVGNDLGFRPQ